MASRKRDQLPHFAALKLATSQQWKTFGAALSDILSLSGRVPLKHAAVSRFLLR
jgi:hypothetical protein